MVCSATSSDTFDTDCGAVCRDCVNSMSVYELTELCDDGELGRFVSRLADYIASGTHDEEI